MSISVCLIVKDEELLLEQCLSSVKDLADEIIVAVDSRTKDSTRDIAKRFTSNVFDFKWNDDFSEARNLVIEKATKDWIFFIDGDEIIAKEDVEKIKNLTKSNEFLAYSFLQVTYTNNASMENFFEAKDYLKKGFNGAISCNIVRLFKKDPDFRFVGNVHEYIEESIEKKGKIFRTNIPIHHYQELKGADFFKKKQLDYLELYEKDIESYPNKVRAYRHMGNIYYTYKKDYDKAIENFNKALNINPNDPRAYLGLGWCYMAKKDSKMAVNAFKKALEINKYSDVLWVSLGKAYALDNKPKAAITCIENAIQINPSSKKKLLPIIAELKNPVKYSYNIKGLASLE
ncbi:MAG TPA: glycosyltransferase [Candidatus Nanoarchaeia archaeon]|nr:glycosyltransferase [Candidatus Nanoarchaeia archaeon]